MSRPCPRNAVRVHNATAGCEYEMVHRSQKIHRQLPSSISCCCHLSPPELEGWDLKPQPGEYQRRGANILRSRDVQECCLGVISPVKQKRNEKVAVKGRR